MIWAAVNILLYFYILTGCQLVTHLCLFYVSREYLEDKIVSQVTIISTPLNTIHTVSKQLHNDKQVINCVNVVNSSIMEQIPFVL